MAIAHVATEYVFSDFLLKEPNKPQYRSVRTELAMDKMVTCVVVGLPLLFISLAFAQEVSVGTQISCFAPSNFSWRQAAYVDSFCWAAVHSHTVPLWLHKFFPYILLLVAMLMYTPALFWRFFAAPILRIYFCDITGYCQNGVNSAPPSVVSDPTEGCFNYPLVEKFLMTKRFSRRLLFYYLLCRGLTLVTLLCACIYMGYYYSLASVKDDFDCKLRVGLLESDPTVPEKVQCKLIAVGVFSLLSLVNLVVFAALMPVVIFAGLRPLLFREHAKFLETYQSLPTVGVLPPPNGQCDDLSMYLLFLEENLSELKSYKYIKVLEMLRRRGECSGENFDTMSLLQTLWPVKMEQVDGKKPQSTAEKLEETKINLTDGPPPDGAAEKNLHAPNPTSENETEMRGQCV
uniref:Pannexin n=1 Tax=Oryzias sinensis TaxID=183150 RepID=A0A8C7WZA7_9TELE